MSSAFFSRTATQVSDIQRTMTRFPCSLTFGQHHRVIFRAACVKPVQSNALIASRSRPLAVRTEAVPSSCHPTAEAPRSPGRSNVHGCVHAHAKAAICRWPASGTAPALRGQSMNTMFTLSARVHKGVYLGVRHCPGDLRRDQGLRAPGAAEAALLQGAACADSWRRLRASCTRPGLSPPAGGERCGQRGLA